MDKEIERVRRPKKNVDVVYVPNEDVVKIVKLPGASKSPRKSEEEILTGKQVLKAQSSHTRSGRKVRRVTTNTVTSPIESEDESDSDDDEEKNIEKPTELFEEWDVAGKEICGFHTPRRRNAMVSKASEALSTPTRTEPVIDPKTPHNIRLKLKKDIIRQINKYNDEVPELEDSGSEYNPTDSDSGDDSLSDSDVRPLDEITTPPKRIVQGSKKKQEALSTYVFTPEEYFENQSSKVITSDHTLSKLRTPKMDQAQLSSLLESVSRNHQTSIIKLNKSNQSMFGQWLFALREGYNILLYGLGSKKSLLNSFHLTHLQSSPVLVVNGFFPGLTLKEILEGISEDLLGMAATPTNPQEALELISTTLKNSRQRIFLIIHNLDGLMLRSDKVQSVLSQLAKLPKLHMLASVDHINCALLWDQKKFSDFNFIWEDVTSFLPYKQETSYENNAMVQRSGSLALASIKSVFQSLNGRSRNIFKILLKNQLENKGKNIAGMSFSELYRECRNNFLVSSDLVLRTQLTEFIDHQLVKWKKETDHLSIPILPGILKQFLTEIEGTEE